MRPNKKASQVLKMAEKEYSIFGLIKYIIGLIFKRFRDKKAEKEEQKERFRNITDELNQDYEEVDKEKKKKARSNLKDRLDNMF